MEITEKKWANRRIAEAEKNWPAWVRRGFRMIEEVEEKEGPSTPWLCDRMPVWAVSMLKGYFQMIGPDVRLEDRSASGPAVLGAFVGHMEMVASEKSGLEEAMEFLSKTVRELNRKILGKLTKQQIASLKRRQKEAKVAIEEVRLKILKECESLERVMMT